MLSIEDEKKLNDLNLPNQVIPIVRKVWELTPESKVIANTKLKSLYFLTVISLVAGFHFEQMVILANVATVFIWILIIVAITLNLGVISYIFIQDDMLEYRQFIFNRSFMSMWAETKSRHINRILIIVIFSYSVALGNLYTAFYFFVTVMIVALVSKIVKNLVQNEINKICT